MPEAFIIMQIGNPDLDAVCGQAIVPALKACGLDPKRVDKHNEGGLLKSEIIGFIERSEIIVADLTNERPNCYLEIGYVMGLGKFQNLILTVREDHSLESPNHVKGGPRIHFDLSGYDILFWSTDRIEELQQELEKRIRRRMAVIAPAASAPLPAMDNTWIDQQRATALAGLRANGSTAFMEVRFALDPPKPTWSPQQLDGAARDATIRTFGWPIGVYLDNRDEFRPHPRADGIAATITADRGFDSWAFRRNGDFFLLASLFEDRRDPARIFFNTRIVRVTEALLYCARLYARLAVAPSATLAFAVRHGGILGRQIGTTDPFRRVISERRPSAENEIETEVRTSVRGIETDLVVLVKALLEPMFAMFDLFTVSDAVYAEIVNGFVQGKVL